MPSLLKVEPVSIAGQQKFDGQPFPLVLECQDSSVSLEHALEWVRTEKENILAQLELAGAILFRNFPTATDLDFDQFVASFDFENFPYSESFSNAVRINRTDRVFTANEAPSNVNIFFHHELAQTPFYPHRIFFYCEQPAESGGETPICRSDVLLEQLAERDPIFVSKCKELGLRYSNVMPLEADLDSGMGRSWKSTLGTESRATAEEKLEKNGYYYQWQEDGSLRMTTPVVPAVRKLQNGRSSFFNQLIAAATGWNDDRNDASKAITFGDGTPLSLSSAKLASELAEPLAFDIPWQKGDIALVDNFSTMHARRTFEGSRKVLASLACPTRN